jgi:prepilin-type N-terminal cleavage/methylation domain-containing protein
LGLVDRVPRPYIPILPGEIPKSAIVTADTIYVRDQFLKYETRKMKKGFSLVEIIIVVTILGILAAVVVPGFQNHVANAKESAVKSDVTTIRSEIELYKLQHKGVPPGYVDGAEGSVATLKLQLTATTAATGAASASTVPVDPYLYGPYLKKIPENPYNGLSTITYVPAGADFSGAADGVSSGWLYKRETGEFRVNWPAADSSGVAFYNF